MISEKMLSGQVVSSMYNSSPRRREELGEDREIMAECFPSSPEK